MIDLVNGATEDTLTVMLGGGRTGIYNVRLEVNGLSSNFDVTF